MTLQELVTRLEAAAKWDCTDNQLCSYEASIDGRKYHAQRTHANTVDIWHGDENIGTAPSPSTWEQDAAKIAVAHALKARSEP